MSIYIDHNTNDISTDASGYPTIGGKEILPYEIQPITASVGSNALTITLNPTVLDFRSSTIGSGTVNRRSVPAAISVTVSSGSTLGTVNAVQSRLAVLAIDNAGTVELAVVNMTGGNNLDETTLISTTAEGGAGAADSANVIYSTTARANVPFRVVGFIDITEATAGTWATGPTTVQGAGGNAVTAMQSVGYSQTWQDLTGSRALATTYYNDTGRPIVVNWWATSTAGANFRTTVNGVIAVNAGEITPGVACSPGQVIVPPGASYSAEVSAGTPGGLQWRELR